MELNLRKVDKNGLAIYEIPNLRGSVYITKSMLKGEPPAKLTVEGVEFAEPGLNGSRVSIDPEKVRKAEEAATKAQERATKAKEKAEALAKRASEIVGGQTQGTVPESVGEVKEVHATA
jgi:hypothetical protein